MVLPVVVNCGAGSVEHAATLEQRREIVEAFADAGAEVAISFVTGENLRDAIATAVKEPADAVVVGGGDGSVSTAAGVLAGGDIPLAVLPLGTLNHFAKVLGMPLTVKGAAHAIVHGHVSRVDVGEVNGRCFVNNSSIGVYPVMVSFRDQIRQERGWGRVPAVPVAAWRVIRRFPVRRMTIDAEDYHERMRSPFVFIGNNHYEIGPGGTGERKRIDAGELWTYVARAESPWRLLWIAAKAAIRGSSHVPELEEICASEVNVDVDGHRVLVAADGESITLRSPLRYRIRPAALAVLAKDPRG